MTKFVALASGKGGVGKTTATINIGQALSTFGHRVILLDANLVTPNLALTLGMVNPEGTVNKFLRHEKGLHQIIYNHDSGMGVIPASPSYDEYKNTNFKELSYIFNSLDNAADFVLVDSPSGVGNEVKTVLTNCDETIVVINPNLSSVMDGLKTIRLAKETNTIVTGIILNMSNKGKFEMKPNEVEAILGYPIMANVRHSKKLRKSCHHNLPCTYLYPRSRESKQFQIVAKTISLEL